MHSLASASALQQQQSLTTRSSSHARMKLHRPITHQGTARVLARARPRRQCAEKASAGGPAVATGGARGRPVGRSPPLEKPPRPSARVAKSSHTTGL